MMVVAMVIMEVDNGSGGASDCDGCRGDGDGVGTCGDLLVVVVLMTVVTEVEEVIMVIVGVLVLR